MFLTKLPPALEDVTSLKRRHEAARTRKDLWRSTYQESYKYAMPARETFSWHTEGQLKNNELYDSTLQEATYAAANTMCALLFPNWQRWMELSPGGAIDPKKITPNLLEQMRTATETFFNFLNHSNFQQTIGEVALDLMVGTGALCFDEGDSDDQPFKFAAIPLPCLELEEGPDGTIESTFMERKPRARDLLRIYPGMEMFDLSATLADAVTTEPDKEVKVLQCEIYYPPNKHYYGIVVDLGSNEIIWRYDYQSSCPTIVARATKVAGETYGRGRVMLALSDAKTLDKMQEFVLRHAANQIAPPMTGVTDGVMNPYTARLFPNTILPVASNETSNPSLRVMDTGGNFQIGDKIMSDLRLRIRRTLLGPDMSEGAIKSATEISVADRNRLWAMNGEYNRIMAELIDKIVIRGMFILAKRGLVPQVKIDGRLVSVTYTSPFARSQNSQDLIALQTTLQVLAQADPTGQQGLSGLTIRTEDLGEWTAKKTGLDMALVRDESERQDIAKKQAEMMQQAQAAQAQGQQPQGG
jgi:hypothetical protein